MNPIPENEHTPDGYTPEIKLDAPDVPSTDTEDGSSFLQPAGDLPTPEQTPPVQTQPPAATTPEHEDAEDPCLKSMCTPAPPESYFPAPPAPAPERGLKKAWQEKRLFVILTAVFAFLAISCAAVIAYVYFVIQPYEEYDRIMPNVYCAGVNLGGMTTQEAQAAIEEALRNPSYSITLELPDCSYEFCPAQEGITLNGEDIAQSAYAYMRSDRSAYGMYKAYLKAKLSEYRLDADTDLVFSEEDIIAQAQTIYEETYVDATASSISNDPEAHTVTVTLGTPGRQIDVEVISAAVIEAFENMDFQAITADYQPVEIDLVALWDLSREAAGEYTYAPVDPTYYADTEAHTIDLVMGTPGYSITANTIYTTAKEYVENGTYGTVTMDMNEDLPADVDITPTYHELACDPIEPYYAYGDVQEGISGYSLDWESAISEIMDASWGQALSIPMIETKPTRTAAEIRAVLFRDELGSYSSPHTANSGRTTNLILCCNAINGTVINPGEVFSFNGVVGERTAAKGYQSAIVYVGSESVSQLGGGICQVASTIYDAALYADMEILDRDCHMYFVTYVKGGLDATVYWGSQDFSFRNNTEYPIRINAYVSGGYVHISIDGTKTNDNYVVLSSTCLSSTPYSVITKYDASLPAGYSSETTSPYTGYVYEAYQYVYSGDGTLLESNYLGKSHYAKRDQVITVGTG